MQKERSGEMVQCLYHSEVDDKIDMSEMSVKHHDVSTVHSLHLKS